MREVAALPPKAGRLRCERCGISAAKPIVVQAGPIARCTNVKACEMRQHRNARRTKPKEKPAA